MRTVTYLSAKLPAPENPVASASSVGGGVIMCVTDRVELLRSLFVYSAVVSLE